MVPDTINPLEHESWSLPVPPGYEPCVAPPIGVGADYVVSPLSMAELFWEDDD